MDTELVVGNKYYWTDNSHSIIENVEVKLEKIKENAAVVKVVDNEKLEQELKEARETYSKNGRNMENVLEVHPLVKGKGGIFAKAKKHVVFDKSNLHEID